MTQAVSTLVFPPALTGRADISRLLRELEALDNDLESQRARSKGKGGSYRLPNMSRALNDFLETNKLDIADDQTRMNLRTQLRKLKDHAPVIHMTFASDADPDSMQRIVAWIRQELHPQALISVGLQPSLVGGVYVRTPNHVHDLSIRAHMRDSRGVIVQDLATLSKAMGIK